MTVNELIEKLRVYKGDTPVYVAGYEGGIDDVGGVAAILVKRDVHPEEEWYYGAHEVVESYEPQIGEPGVLVG